MAPPPTSPAVRRVGQGGAGEAGGRSADGRHDDGEGGLHRVVPNLVPNPASFVIVGTHAGFCPQLTWACNEPVAKPDRLDVDLARG